MQRKYDMHRLRESCSLFVSKVKLTFGNLTRWHILATKYDFKEAMRRCRQHVKSLVGFEGIER